MIELILSVELAILIFGALVFMLSARGLSERVFFSRQQQLPRPEAPRVFDWHYLGNRRNGPLRLPTNADSGKLDPIRTAEDGYVASIELRSSRADRFSPERRLSDVDYREILTASTALWSRIGGNAYQTPLQSSEAETDTPD